MRGKLLLASLLISTFAYARSARVIYDIPDAPWFTGPLLAPSGHVVPVGSFNIEPYVISTAFNGVYNEEWKKIEEPTFWNIQIQVPFWAGITEWMDVLISPTWNFNVCEGAYTSTPGDLTVAFDFALLVDSPDNHYPAIKLGLRESFPVGPYQRLNPNKNGTDFGGSGAYETSAVLSLSRLIQIREIYWTNLRLVFTAEWSSRVPIHGFSLYGGDADTNGIIYPPFHFQADFAFEINLSRSWTAACDIVGDFRYKYHFKGNPGASPEGLVQGPITQYSVAPAIEYNWNADLGVITGAWFTFAGKNADAFASWVTALNYYY